MRQAVYLLTIWGWVWSGCSSTKSIPANDKLYTGANIKVDSVSGTKERKTLQSNLNDLTRPKPNSKFLGMRTKLGFYNLFYGSKPKSFFGKLRDKWGEPPVLLSQVDLQQNTQSLETYLFNKGYFNGTVTGDTVTSSKNSHAEYKAFARQQYKIDSINFPTDSSELSRVIRQSMKKTFLEKGKPFDLDVIKGERSRIDAYLKERGFYFFNPEYILVKTDSTNGDHLTNMYITIKPGTPVAAQRIHSINDVYIYTNYGLNNPRFDTTKNNAEFYKGYYIIQRRKRYKPKLFAESMQFKKGDVYNRTEHNLTLSRLINLDLFKFVKNRFELTKEDSAKLDAYYYLTPQLQKSLQAEFTYVTRSNSLNGGDITFSWKHRNFFQDGSHLKLSAYIGSDIQFSGAFAGYNTLRTGAEADLSIPRAKVPLFRIKGYSGYAPRTDIKLGYDILKRIGLYTLNSFRIQYGYNWKSSIQKTHELYPININYVQPLDVTSDYDSLERIYPGLDRAIEEQFIIGATYHFNYNQAASALPRINSFYFNGIIDVSGNIPGLITGANVKKGDTVKVFNLPFSQYVKLEAEGRFNHKMGSKSNWASRIDIGVGLPYGNSVQLPYVKQFFVGGSNSLRGFRSRAVGPGTYIQQDSVNVVPDQTGDIKFEINTEYRPHISGPIYGAVFLEAGNIWLVNDSTYTQKPGAQFTSKWLNQLAVDVGIGLRFDITVFVIRLDVGFPLRKPWLKDPWVVNDIHLWSSVWTKNNLVYNLAIGYPF